MYWEKKFYRDRSRKLFGLSQSTYIVWIVPIHIYRQDAKTVWHGKIQELILIYFIKNTSLQRYVYKAKIMRYRMERIFYALIMRSIMYVMLYKDQRYLML
jgi:hypothetical protein